MVIDTSALIAILFQEPDAAVFSRAIASSTVRRISAGTMVEAGIVLDSKRGPGSEADLDDLIERSRLRIEPVTATQAQLARRAYRLFGKGNHPAGLNFGDCFAYALAKESGEPLLFKGNDFARTDVQAVRL
jgi:ribonuclease VapC